MDVSSTHGPLRRRGPALVAGSPCILPSSPSSFLLPSRLVSDHQVVTQEWYRDFCQEANLPRDMLFDVLRAANYMGIPALLDLCCLKVTFMLHGRNAEEVGFRRIP